MVKKNNFDNGLFLILVSCACDIDFEDNFLLSNYETRYLENMKELSIEKKNEYRVAGKTSLVNNNFFQICG